MFPITVYANSAEPPSYIIVCLDCPDDLELTASYKHADESYSELLKGMEFTDNMAKRKTAQGVFFEQYGPYHPIQGGITITAASSEKTLSFVIEKPNGYNSVYTLDYAKEKLTAGAPAKFANRQYILVALRVALTLVIEGLIFFVFRYRTKKSWRVFLITNLITQGLLNLVVGGMLDAVTFIYSGVTYAFIMYILVEPVIFIVEMIVFGIALNERKRGWGVLCAFLANLASLIIGGVVIAMLPV